jgi:RNA polymerase sigma factor (sigma-70 family)
MQHDDALDAKLYESGDIAQLLARYHETILAVCIARMRGHADAEDVAQNVRMRLYREFERGRRYSVPYRVVVFKVTEWTVKEYFQGLKIEDPLPEDWHAGSSDPEDELVTRFHLEQVLAGLPAREQQVAELRWVRALEPDEIAAELEIERNNVYQALSRAKGKLAEAGVG